jgi:hypothetical protein
VVQNEEEPVFSLHQGGILEARIVDESGRPLRLFRAAQILSGESVEYSQAEWYRADADGRFTITLPSKPSYLLFRKPGYEDVLMQGKDLFIEGQTYRFIDDTGVTLHWTGIQ